MEKIELEATLMISLNISCPECEEHIDLVSDTDLNDEGWILGEALPDGPWVYAHEKFECSLKCPECNVELNVKGIDW
jgi:hypothetical protein